MLGSETAIPVNAAFATAVAILLMWANGRLPPWVAIGLLVALAAGMGTWLARRTLTQIEAQEQALDSCEGRTGPAHGFKCGIARANRSGPSPGR